MKSLVKNWQETEISNESPSARRSAGDSARDAKDWTTAEIAYNDYLNTTPDDQAIWVQYGHALKEQGKLPDAEAAYRMSLSLSADDADGYMQLGHVLKLQNRIDEAGEAYARSLELKPTKSARDELEYCGRRIELSSVLPPRHESLATDTIFFEVDDLLGFLHVHVTVSGIQRVQIGILQRILLAIKPGTQSKFIFVRTSTGNQAFWELDPVVLKSLVDYCTGERIERGRVITLLKQLDQSALIVQPTRGQCYFIMGAFWGFNGDATRYAKLKALGVSVGVYIYDLIPVSHPEYCDAGLVSDFALALGDGLAVFDFVLTISEFSASEVRRFILERQLQQIPVQAVVLAHVLNDAVRSKPSRESPWTSSLVKLQNRRFVLIVSTIEPRKNHVYLLSAWRLMLQEGLEVPDLVFVGRHGWRVNDFMEQLRATDYLAGRVHVLHDLSDAEMQTLYNNCLFTAFPSFVEGWGLPVGESLAHGQVCVAANTSSIPEVGGDLVEYIDPFNVRSGVETFRRLIMDQAYLEKRRGDIRAKFEPRTWETVTTELLRSIAEHRSSKVDGWRPPLLRPGEVFRPGDLRLGQTIPANYSARPIRLILAEGWYRIEQFGVWMHGTGAIIRFATDLKAGEEVVVYLRLAGSPSHAGATLTISAVDEGFPVRSAHPFPPQALSPSVRMSVAFNQQFSARLLGRVACNGEITFSLSVEGNIPFVSAEDQRRLSVGLILLAYAARSDSATRADIIDALQEA